MNFLNYLPVSVLVIFVSCQTTDLHEKGTFGYDLQNLSLNETPVILTNDNAYVLISSEYQARVITSASNGLYSKSYGWIDYKTLDDNKDGHQKQSYGGEDRLWLGPLGSRFTMFYGGDEITGSNWQVPTLVDTVAFALIDKTSQSAKFQKRATIKNNIGTEFNIEITRQIDLLSKKDVEDELGINIPESITFVGFQSDNNITNLGTDWMPEKGLIAPWVLGMFPGQKGSVAIFPFVANESTPLNLQKYLNEFGEDRVQILDSTILFQTDGMYRSKIGLKPENTKPIMGHYNPINQVLTIITFSYDATGNFLSSTETGDTELFGGDVVNSYNNGADKGKPTFFELESAAPARVLTKGASISHVHATFHFEGDFTKLNEVSKAVLGFDLEVISKAFEGS